MSKEYSFNIKTDSLDYQFKLTPTKSEEAGVVIGGIAYSIHPRSKQERQAIELLLRNVQSNQPATVREFVSCLRRIPNIQAVTVTKQKTHLTGIASLIPSSPAKRGQVEDGLLPRIPTTPGPIQPTHILERMKELGVPGVSIAVINRGKIEWSGGYGDLEHSPLVQAGSVSKMINGLVVLSLIDQCQKAQKLGLPSGLVGDQMITLDTDVSTLIDPDLWLSIDPNHMTDGDKAKLTIRQLLAHTGGIPGHGGFDGYPQVPEIVEEIAALSKEIEALRAIDPSTEPDVRQRLEDLSRRLAKSQAALDKAYKGMIPDTDQVLRGEGNSPPIKIE